MRTGFAAGCFAFAATGAGAFFACFAALTSSLRFFSAAFAAFAALRPSRCRCLHDVRSSSFAFALGSCRTPLRSERNRRIRHSAGKTHPGWFPRFSVGICSFPSDEIASLVLVQLRISRKESVRDSPDQKRSETCDGLGFVVTLRVGRSRVFVVFLATGIAVCTFLCSGSPALGRATWLGLRCRMDFKRIVMSRRHFAGPARSFVVNTMFFRSRNSLRFERARVVRSSSRQSERDRNEGNSVDKMTSTYALERFGMVN